LGIYLFKTLSMQKENKKTPEYNSLSSIFDGVAATAQFYAFLCKKEKKLYQSYFINNIQIILRKRTSYKRIKIL